MYLQGKFIRCHFSQTGKLAGADIESCKIFILFNKSTPPPQVIIQRAHIYFIYYCSNEYFRAWVHSIK